MAFVQFPRVAACRYPQLLRVRRYDLMIYPILFFRTRDKVITGEGMYTKIRNTTGKRQ